MSDVAPASGSTQEAAAPDASPGLGGWLVLPAIGLLISPLANLVGLVPTIQLFAKGEFAVLCQKNIILAAAVVVEFVGTLALVGYIIYTAAAFFRCKRSAPKLMTWMYIVSVLWVIVLGFWVTVGTGGAQPGAGTSVVRAVVIAAIWIPYFNVSKRVKKTFVVP